MNFKENMMQKQRQLKVSFNKSGGTAGKGGITNRITIPTAWIKEMGIDLESREVIATFDGNKIIIEKK
jgi:hypothetical protein